MSASEYLSHKSGYLARGRNDVGHQSETRWFRLSPSTTAQGPLKHVTFEINLVEICVKGAEKIATQRINR